MARLGVPGWQFGLGELTTDVACGGGIHTIAWRRGKLVLCDHDVLAEAATLALGGEPPRCMQVLYAWRQARRNARFVQIDDETISYFRARNLPLGEQFHAALLPEPLRQLRERTTWLHALRSGADRQKNRSTILVKTMRRLAEGALDRVVEPLREGREAMEIVPSAKVLPRGAPAKALGRPGGGHMQIAEVYLPPEWLATVALLDVCEVDGAFVLAVDAGGPECRDLGATVLRWRATPTGRLAADISGARLERPNDTWNLRQ